MHESVNTWINGQTYSLTFSMNTYFRTSEITAEVYGIEDITKPSVPSDRVILNKYKFNTRDTKESFNNVTKLRKKSIEAYSSETSVLSRTENLDVTVCYYRMVLRRLFSNPLN